MSKHVLFLLSFIVLVCGCIAYGGETQNLADLPAYNAASESDPILPWRRDQEKRSEKIEQGVDKVAQSLLQGNQDQLRISNEILNELKSLRQEKQVQKPVDEPKKEVKEEKPSLVERVKDRIEDRKDLIGDKLDELVESKFLRRVLVLVAIFAVVWFSVKKHKKEGTPTHLERLSEAVKLGTAGIPGLNVVTSLADRAVDFGGDKIRSVQDRMAERKAEAEARKAEAEAVAAERAASAKVAAAPVAQVTAPAKLV